MGNKAKVVAITHYCSLSDLAVFLTLVKKIQTQVPQTVLICTSDISPRASTTGTSALGSTLNKHHPSAQPDVNCCNKQIASPPLKSSPFLMFFTYGM